MTSQRTTAGSQNQYMDLQEGKQKFIESWGIMASEWGINRAMAQVHALLLVAPEPMTADDVMERLGISRGNANINLRALMDWGLVHKQLRPGSRKEFFYAEKDMWVVFRQILVQRKKRELEPMLRALEDVSCVEASCPESESFCHMVKEIRSLSRKADQTLDLLAKADSSWFSSVFFKMIR
ncbi:MAG: GbsR/MarR family transcriptional regulator [Saprospiraceae bacterium]